MRPIGKTDLYRENPDRAWGPVGIIMLGPSMGRTDLRRRAFVASVSRRNGTEKCGTSGARAPYPDRAFGAREIRWMTGAYPVIGPLERMSWPVIIGLTGRKPNPPP